MRVGISSATNALDVVAKATRDEPIECSRTLTYHYGGKKAQDTVARHPHEMEPCDIERNEKQREGESITQNKRLAQGSLVFVDH